MGWDPDYVKCITCHPYIDWPLLILTASHLCIDMFCGKMNYVEVKISRVARVPSKQTPVDATSTSVEAVIIHTNVCWEVVNALFKQIMRYEG